MGNKQRNKKNSGAKAKISLSFERKLHLLIFGFVVLLYGNTLFNDYNFDDTLVTRDHRLTSQGISAIPEIFTSQYYVDGQGHSYGYRPIVLVTFAIEHAIFGESPEVSHFFNLLIYAFTGMLLFAFLRLLFREYNYVFPLLVSLLFLAHPLHTEVVASIKNRDELLSFLGALAALYFALKFIDHKKAGFFLLVPLCFVLAVLSKKSALPIVAVIPIMLVFFRKPTVMQLFYLMLPLAPITMLLTPLTLVIERIVLFMGVLLFPFAVYWAMYLRWLHIEPKLAVARAVSEKATLRSQAVSIQAGSAVFYYYKTALVGFGKFLFAVTDTADVLLQKLAEGMQRLVLQNGIKISSVVFLMFKTTAYLLSRSTMLVIRKTTRFAIATILKLKQLFVAVWRRLKNPGKVLSVFSIVTFYLLATVLSLSIDVRLFTAGVLPLGVLGFLFSKGWKHSLLLLLSTLSAILILFFLKEDNNRFVFNYLIFLCISFLFQMILHDNGGVKKASWVSLIIVIAVCATFYTHNPSGVIVALAFWIPWTGLLRLFKKRVIAYAIMYIGWIFTIVFVLHDNPELLANVLLIMAAYGIRLTKLGKGRSVQLAFLVIFVLSIQYYTFIGYSSFTKFNYLGPDKRIELPYSLGLGSGHFQDIKEQYQNNRADIDVLQASFFNPETAMLTSVQMGAKVPEHWLAQVTPPPEGANIIEKPSAPAKPEIENQVDKDSAKTDSLVTNAPILFQHFPDVLPLAGRELNYPESALFYEKNRLKKAATISAIFARYCQLLLVPYPQSFYYGTGKVPVVDFKNVYAIAGLLLLLVLLLGVLRYYRSKSIWVFGTFCFLITYSISSNIVVPMPGMMAERFVYFASLGFCLLLAWLIVKLLKIDFKTPEVSFKILTQKGVIICGVLLTLFSGLTILRNFDWKNEYKLYSADIKHSGNSVQVNFMLARNLNGQAYQAESNEDFNRLINEAITYYQRSVELYSGYGNAWFDMGTAAKAIGNMPLTISCYTKASHLLPDFPDPNEQLAFIYQQQGQFDSAIVYYNKALAISESNPDVFLNYGMLRLNQGELRQGIELTKRAVALNPNLYNGFINLGKAYERLGQIRDAIFWYEKALALNPAEQGLAGHIENLRHTTQSVPAP